MLMYVEKILSFGFIGLSFLMLFLAYDLIRKTLKTGNDVKPNTVRLIKTFMNIALVFMVLAGPLHWVTIGVKHWVEEKKVNLHVALNTQRWDEKFGQISIRKNGDFQPITVESVSREFIDDEEILINVDEVIEAIRKMRKQMAQINREVSSTQEAERDTLEEG